MNKIVKRIRIITHKTNKAVFRVGDLIRPNVINIGKAAKTYRGILENVPVRVGVSIASQEKIR